MHMRQYLRSFETPGGKTNMKNKDVRIPKVDRLQV